LAAGVCRGDRLDRRARHARGGGRHVLCLPVAGLRGAAIMSVMTRPRDRTLPPMRTREEIAAAYQPRQTVPFWTIVRHAVLIGFCAVVVLPLLWVVLLSIKSLPDAYQNHIWPNVFDFSHYGYAWDKIPTLRQN